MVQVQGALSTGAFTVEEGPEGAVPSWGREACRKHTQGHLIPSSAQAVVASPRTTSCALWGGCSEARCQPEGCPPGGVASRGKEKCFLRFHGMCSSQGFPREAEPLSACLASASPLSLFILAA